MAAQSLAIDPGTYGAPPVKGNTRRARQAQAAETLASNQTWRGKA